MWVYIKRDFNIGIHCVWCVVDFYHPILIDDNDDKKNTQEMSKATIKLLHGRKVKEEKMNERTNQPTNEPKKVRHKKWIQ